MPGNFLVARRVSPGRIIVVLFRTKYVVPHQIKPRILKLTIRRGQSNISSIFVCVSCGENDYYRVVSAGQLSFDCRSYCGRSCRMQGGLLCKPRLGISWSMAAMLCDVVVVERLLSQSMSLAMLTMKNQLHEFLLL